MITFANRTRLRRGPRSRVSALTGFPGVGGYEGARSDRSATRNWLPRLGSADADVVPDLLPIRARTRDLARNAPLVAGAIQTKLDAIIGPGLVPHPRLDRDFLGLSEEQANDWQKQAARLWWAIAGTTRLDIRRRFTFAQLSWIVFSSTMTDGDHFYRRRFKERPGDLLGLKIQLVEADRVSNPNHAPDRDDMIEGVAIDEDGSFTGFHVADRHPGDTISFRQPRWTLQPAFGANGDPLMRQIADIRRDGQTRGISELAPVVEAVKQLSRYSGAELDAAVVTSFITLLIKTQDGSLRLPPMGTGAGQPQVGFQGGPASAAADKQLELAPAAVLGLMPGEDIASFNPQRPNSGFEQFFRAFCSIIGVGIGLPHELLIKHFTSSFSASRGAMIEAWRGFKAKRALLSVDQWAQPIWEWFIDECVARGYLSAPGYFDDTLIRAAYCECQWSGPIMGQLNPQQETAAAKERVDMGVSTLEEETAEITGGDDWERKHEQRVREHKLRVAGGLEPELLNASTRASINEPNTAGSGGDGSPADEADSRELQEAGGAR